MDEATARRLCSLIAGVLCSDGTMSSEESAFLKKVMAQCGLETDTAVMAMYGEDLAEEMAQLPPEARAQAMDLVIQAAAADGQVVASERAWVDAVAYQLGVAPDDVAARIQRALGNA
jgi:uncharacterized tellurite resistance protein B-like protein